MSIPELNQFKIHTYRNTNSMISFDVSDKFVFIITQQEESLDRFYIHQYIHQQHTNKICIHQQHTNQIYIHQQHTNQIYIHQQHTNKICIHQQHTNQICIHQHNNSDRIDLNIGKTSPMSAEIPFKPVFSCFNDGKFIIASKYELFYFKYELFKIGNINPLSMTFFYKDDLISIDCKEVSIYNINIGNSNNNNSNDIDNINNNIEESDCVRSFTLNMESNGICSAHCIFDDHLYLGFENGTVGVTPMEDFLNSDSPTVDTVECFDDPVLTVIVREEFIFVHTLTSIFRIDRHNTISDERKKNVGIYTKIRAMKILHQDFTGCSILILLGRDEVIFMDFNLKVKKAFRSTFEIRDCKILGDSMFLGFKNGLLVEFSLIKIKNSLFNPVTSSYRYNCCK